MPSQPSARRYRFGIFEADTASGELRKSGVRVRLQDQPFQVLVLLLQRPGEVLTREELRQELWPDGTFVDFDHSLNSTINKLREVLGDSASNPRFIETLARRGYRFLAPVSGLEDGSRPAPIPTTPTQEVLREPSPAAVSKSLLTRPEDLPPVPHGYVRFFFVLIQIMYLSFYAAALARLSAIEDILDQVFRVPGWIAIIAIVSAAIGIPVRLYLLAAVFFNVKDVSRKFLRIFAPLFLLDELWALSPFLLMRQIGWGLALGATAALIYVPFSERTLVLMRDHRGESGQ